MHITQNVHVHDGIPSLLCCTWPVMAWHIEAHAKPLLHHTLTRAEHDMHIHYTWLSYYVHKSDKGQTSQLST